MSQSRIWVAVACLSVGLVGARGAEIVNPGGATPPLGQPGIGATGNAFTFSSLAVAEFATEQLSAGTFTESGFLSVTGATSGKSTFTPVGLGGSTANGTQTSGLYTLYVAFTATGTSTANNFNTPSPTPYNGTYTSFNYTLYGVNGQATFAFVGTTPAVEDDPNTPVVLAMGGLVEPASPGSDDSSVTVESGGTPSPGSPYQIDPSSTNLQLDLIPNTAEAGFFVSPGATATFDLNGAFTADPGVVSLVNNNTIEINNGRGTLTPVPEPASAALACAGLGLLGARGTPPGSISGQRLKLATQSGMLRPVAPVL